MTGITDLVLGKSKNPKQKTPTMPSTNYFINLLKLTKTDPNGPLIYDMMTNRSSRWRDKHMRSNILPPGWKMGISRLGRVPVYDPLYEPVPPLRAIESLMSVGARDGQTVRMRRREMVQPRYQATDPQHDYATDEYNLGLPPHLAQLYDDNMRRRGGHGGGGGGRSPWLPPLLGGRGRGPVLVDDFLDDELDDDVADPKVDILERQRIPPRGPFPPHGIHHRPGHVHPGHHHHGRHRTGHGLGLGYPHDDMRDENLVDRENADRELDDAAKIVAHLQRERDIESHRRREGRARLQEEHGRLHEERLARRHAEDALAAREQQFDVSEAERVRGEIKNKEQHERVRGRRGRGLDHGLRQGYRGGGRVVRDRDGRAVVVDDHLQQRELVHIPVHDPHLQYREYMVHHGHHEPQRRGGRQARHVRFAGGFNSSEEERHKEGLRQEAYPLARRRRCDRERSPYHFLEDELGEYARDEFYDSADEYYHPHQKLLMPPRKIHGNWWEDGEYLSTDDD